MGAAPGSLFARPAFPATNQCAKCVIPPASIVGVPSLGGKHVAGRTARGQRRGVLTVVTMSPAIYSFFRACGELQRNRPVWLVHCLMIGITTDREIP